MLSDIALYLPFMLLPDSNIPLVLVMLFCAVMTEFCGVLAQTINGIRSYAGPLGKSDRALVFGTWGLALAIWPQLVQWNNVMWGLQPYCWYGQSLTAAVASYVMRLRNDDAGKSSRSFLQFYWRQRW